MARSGVAVADPRRDARGREASGAKRIFARSAAGDHPPRRKPAATECGHQGAGRAPARAQALPCDARRSRGSRGHCRDRPRRLGVRLGCRSRRRRSVAICRSAERVPAGRCPACAARCRALAASRGCRADHPRRPAVGRRRARAERPRPGGVGVGVSGVGDESRLDHSSLGGSLLRPRHRRATRHPSASRCHRGRHARACHRVVRAQPSAEARRRASAAEYASPAGRTSSETGRRTASARAGPEPPRETSTRSLPRSFAR